MSMEPSEMRGKVALVTGIAGDLGQSTALRLAEAGASVGLVDVDADAVEQLAEGIRAFEAVALPICGDITDRAFCHAAVGQTVEAFGRLDALCNVANAFLPSNSLKTRQADWELTLAINLSAPFYLTQAALPHLIENGGAVVNVLSCVAFMAQPFTAAYTASKAGLLQMTKALAAEFIDDNVRINMVSPGSMATGTGSVALIPDDLDPSLFHKITSVRGKIGVDEVSSVIAFLASSAGRSYHGACITLDNGVSLG